jgi:hypothetical protein
MPDFLSDFFYDQRIRSSKPMSNISDDFIKQLSASSNEINVVSKKSASKKAISLDSILLMENDEEKEPFEFLEKCTDDNLKSEIYIAFFSIYSRMKNPLKMIEIFKLMNLNLDNPQMKGV